MRKLKKKGITRNAFVTTVLEDWLNKEGVFRFKHFNVYNDHFTLFDETQDSLIDVFIRNGTLICGLDDSTDCVHVKFCYSLPEAQTLLKKGLIRSVWSVKRTPDIEIIKLKKHAYPTIAGRELTKNTKEIRSSQSILIPYTSDGSLMKVEELGNLLEYLSPKEIQGRLMARTCVSRAHKPWYAFHENPPLAHILRPKILCKDITLSPRFWVDSEGTIVPRHSVYYIVPFESSLIPELVEYLNSDSAKMWLETHCQRAANGFLRLQSHILKQLPIPERLVSDSVRYGHSCATEEAVVLDGGEGSLLLP
jgi:hypothetical protein